MREYIQQHPELNMTQGDIVKSTLTKAERHLKDKSDGRPDKPPPWVPAAHTLCSPITVLQLFKLVCVLSEMVTRCSVPSWCQAWRTSPARSAWSCAARGGSCWNRATRMVTRNAANRCVQNHQAGKNKQIIRFCINTYSCLQRKKEYEIEMHRFLSVSFIFVSI